MELYLDEIVKQISLYCQLSNRIEGFKLIYYMLELDDSEGISHIEVNKLLSLHKFPNWDTIKQITIKDIL